MDLSQRYHTLVSELKKGRPVLSSQSTLATSISQRAVGGKHDLAGMMSLGANGAGCRSLIALEQQWELGTYHKRGCMSHSTQPTFPGCVEGTLWDLAARKLPTQGQAQTCHWIVADHLTPLRDQAAANSTPSKRQVNLEQAACLRKPHSITLNFIHGLRC